jgi:peptidoglycan-associated lipoprotein
MNVFVKSLAVAAMLAVAVGCSTTKKNAGSEGGSATPADPSETTTVSDPGASNPVAENVVYFDFDSSEIRAEYNDLLMAHAKKAAESGAKLVVEGHCDERGSREYNIGLGERRAQAVKQFLVLNGVNADNVTTNSYGEERPSVDAHDEDAWSKNRRAELVYESQ